MGEQQFFAMLTPYGKSVARDVFNSGETVKLTHMAVGWGTADTGSGGYTPDAEQGDLLHEWHRFALNRLFVDPNNPAWLTAEGIIREDIGGHWVHEISVIDDKGGVIAICNWPATYKPNLSDGSGQALVIQMVIEVSDTNNFTLEIDGSLALVTRDEFLSQIDAIRNDTIESVKEWASENFTAPKLISRDEHNATREGEDGGIFTPIMSGGNSGVRHTVTIVGGELVDSTDNRFLSGEVVSITATPPDGENFSGWEGPVVFDDINSANTTFTMPDFDVVLTAITKTKIIAAPITGVSHPLPNTTPNTGINNGVGFSAALEWIDAPEVFEAGQEYTARITLSAQTGYTFNGSGFDGTAGIAGFKVNGVAPVFVSNDGATLVFDIILVAGKIYGARWNYGQSSTVLTRLYDAVGKTFTPAVGGAGGSSGFDNDLIYRDIRLCNYNNGAVSAYLGEPGFTRSPSSGDVMVEIPRFWFKVVKDTTAQTIDFLIASYQPDETWKVSPRHGPTADRPEGREKIYVSAYTLNSNYRSVSGNQSQVNITRATARTSIHNRGANYWQFDFAALGTLQLLYLVEVADMDSQRAVGQGYTDSGNTAQQNTGGADSIAFHSGSTVTSTSATGRVKYRHIENFWGNLWQFVDGINFNDAMTYISTEPSQYADDTNNNYSLLSFTKATANGFIKAFGFDPQIPYALVPVDTTGADGSYASDNYWQNTGWRVLYIGGCWNNSSYAGVFAFNSNTASTNTNTSVGCRLLVLP